MDLNDAAFGHGLTRVEKNVVEDLTDLAGVDFGKPEIVRNVDVDAGLRAGACEMDRIRDEPGN